MAAFRRLASSLSRLAAAEATPASQNMGARTFGGHAHDVPADRFVTYAGVTLQKPSPYEYYGSKLLGGFMWFWVWYRLYNDWDEKVLGLAHVFDHEGDDDDHHH